MDVLLKQTMNKNETLDHSINAIKSAERKQINERRKGLEE